MTTRQEAGLELAKSGKCVVKGRVVRVPSRSKPGQFWIVNLKVERDPRCGCPDAVVNRHLCAHIWAGRHLLESLPEGGVSERIHRPPKRYLRCWATYNAAEVAAPAAARVVFSYLASRIVGLPAAGVR